MFSGGDDNGCQCLLRILVLEGSSALSFIGKKPIDEQAHSRPQFDDSEKEKCGCTHKSEIKTKTTPGAEGS